jgi:hypothetical protein
MGLSYPSLLFRGAEYTPGDRSVNRGISNRSTRCAYQLETCLQIRTEHPGKVRPEGRFCPDSAIV